MAKTAKQRRTLSSMVIAAMKAAGWLRNDAYALREGFTGKYTIDDVVASKTRNAEDDNNFSVQVTGLIGKQTIPGSVIANARILAKSEITAEAIAGADHVYYADKIADLLAGSQPFHQAQGFGDDDYEFPENFKIVGASVQKDPVEDHPRMPLRKYKNYSEVLRHHQAIVADETAFITRELFNEYLAVEGEGRPKGVPASVTKMTLLDSVKPEDMMHWSFTLLLADVAEV